MKSHMCIFYVPEKNECSALTKLSCEKCKFKRIIGETPAQYRVRKREERKAK